MRPVFCFPCGQIKALQNILFKLHAHFKSGKKQCSQSANSHAESSEAACSMRIPMRRCGRQHPCSAKQEIAEPFGANGVYKTDFCFSVRAKAPAIFLFFRHADWFETKLWKQARRVSCAAEAFRVPLVCARARRKRGKHVFMPHTGGKAGYSRLSPRRGTHFYKKYFDITIFRPFSCATIILTNQQK